MKNKRRNVYEESSKLVTEEGQVVGSRNKKIYILCVIIIIIFSLTGCGNKSNEDAEKLKSKNKEELAYLDTIIIEMANRLNNISFENYEVVPNKTNQNNNQTNSNASSGPGLLQNEVPDGGSSGSESSDTSVKSTEMTPINIIANSNKDIDWDKLSYEVEKIYEAWSSTILDCYKLNARNEDILDFSDKLDHLTLNVKKKDKANTLVSLTQLYSNIAKFIDSYDSGSVNANIAYTKSNILNAYSNAEQNKWDEALLDLVSAEDYFNNIVNNIEYNKDNKANVDKTFILLKELQKSINLKDKEVFLVKYKLLMREIKILK